MVKLTAAQLTASGRPVLFSGEVEQQLLDQVDLEFLDSVDGVASRRHKGGYSTLTNMRLFWIDVGSAPAAGASCWLPVHAVLIAAKKTRFGLPPKVRLLLEINVTGPEPRPALAGEPSQGTAHLALRCRSGAPDALLDRLLHLTRSTPPPPPELLGGVAAAAAGGTAAGRPPPPPPTASTSGRQDGGGGGGGGGAPAIDEAMLSQVIEMGFARNPALHALLATHNTSVEAAMDWLLAFADGTPGIDQVPPALQPQAAPAFSAVANPYAPSAYAASSYAPSPSGAQGPAGGIFGNPLHGGGGDAMPSPSAAGASHAGRPAGGVAGIVRREQEKAAVAGQSLGQAFQDLSALMAMAGDMVKLAERFRGVASTREQLAGQGGEELVDAETQLDLIALGLSSPVTKQSAGSRYMTELSRQLADFLTVPLARAGGQMGMPDVYCLFNRARGTELLSPDDLLAAARMFAQLGIPLTLRTYPSGVTVVQSSQHTDESVARRLRELSAPPPTPMDTSSSGSGGGASAGGADASASGLGPPLGASDAARHLGVSVTIAKEHLLTAEGMGVLCRDDGPEGLRFYRNFFVDAPPAAQWVLV